MVREVGEFGEIKYCLRQWSVCAVYPPLILQFNYWVMLPKGRMRAHREVSDELIVRP